ncbi:MAG: sulfurtransferase complex subunit TusD [Candidatus Schmidhempelia sp.]|nr:sulfurtransferase complex subunit TusD [Candidatus Schmidhempelia sp.]
MSTEVTLSYTLIIMGPVYGTQQSYLAYQFASQLVTTEHVIKQIFFYADGVTNANSFTHPANDEFNLQLAWQQLAQHFDLPLVICTSAGLRRGIVQNEKIDNIADGFQVNGLMALSEAIAVSDRVITF